MKIKINYKVLILLGIMLIGYMYMLFLNNSVMIMLL